MPTHKTECLTCGESIYCTNEAMVSVGGGAGEGGCYAEPHYDFCNTECAETFRAWIAKAIAQNKEWM